MYANMAACSHPGSLNQDAARRQDHGKSNHRVTGRPPVSAVPRGHVQPTADLNAEDQAYHRGRGS